MIATLDQCVKGCVPAAAIRTPFSRPSRMISERSRVTCWLNTQAHEIDRGGRRIVLGTGEPLAYDRLILAMGSLSLLLLDLPYRVIYRGEFEAATWQGHHCYVLGEGADDFLLFCPQIAAPRNRRVSKRATDLERAGVKEHIFNLLSPDSDRQP